MCIKKWNISKKIIGNAFDEICSYCKISLINMDTIKKALYLHEKYRYSYYDSLILASALENGCKMIFTEDLQNGQVIEKTLKVVNIFI
ncbi:MAG: PIN domain-containing protein [Chitinispirillales bacterium]|nr:PIN domain-containing protein [Chitinispirillales bacterium]